MKKNTDLSIVIVSYDTRTLLDNCLKTVYQSLELSDVTSELIVVDNGSTDGSPEMIKKKYQQVKLILNKDNAGYGRANDQGIAAAGGEIILLLNSDIEVLDRSIVTLYRFFKTLPEKSVAGGKLYNSDMTPQTSCGPAYTLINIFAALLLKGDFLNITRYSPEKVKKVDWVMGACMMMSKIAFNEVGGFDENIFMYMDEIDWQYRAKKLGYQIYFYPDAHFVHVGAASSQGRSTPILNVFRGLMYYYDKHYGILEKVLLRVILILKALLAIGLFTVLNKKSDQKLYKEALDIALKG